MIKCEIISKGYGLSGRINFVAISDINLTPSDLRVQQIQLGYHPAGYDFFYNNNIHYDAATKLNTYTWSCSASCD